jgi:ankyrin repeat protein
LILSVAYRFFIERGVDVNHVAPSGGTALMFAAAGGFYEASKLLIEAGANVNIAMEASAQYIDKVVADIAEGKEGVEPHKNGLTALMFAASEGHLDVVKLLIDEHADLLAVDDEGDSALIYALKGNFTSVATYLVEQGSNPSDTFEDDKVNFCSLY